MSSTMKFEEQNFTLLPFFQEDFLPLYDLHFSFLWTTFSGKTEEELSGHLENVREWAKRMGMHWAHRRSCFLLGRLCAKKLKLSQVKTLRFWFWFWFNVMIHILISH